MRFFVAAVLTVLLVYLAPAWVQEYVGQRWFLMLGRPNAQDVLHAYFAAIGVTLFTLLYGAVKLAWPDWGPFTHTGDLNKEKNLRPIDQEKMSEAVQNLTNALMDIVGKTGTDFPASVASYIRQMNVAIAGAKYEEALVHVADIEKKVVEFAAKQIVTKTVPQTLADLRTLLLYELEAERKRVRAEENSIRLREQHARERQDAENMRREEAKAHPERPVFEATEKLIAAVARTVHNRDEYFEENEDKEFAELMTDSLKPLQEYIGRSEYPEAMDALANLEAKAIKAGDACNDAEFPEAAGNLRKALYDMLQRGAGMLASESSEIVTAE